MNKEITLTKRRRGKSKPKLLELFWEHKVYFFILFLIIFSGVLVFAPDLHFSKTSRQFVAERVKSGVNFIEDQFESRALSRIRQKDGFTSGLVLGIDSRDLDFDGQEFRGKDRNTDTIVQVVYDHKNNNLFEINLPRDTGYEVEEDCAKQGYDKAINRLYRYGQDGNCPGGGIELMKKYVGKITGFEVNYHALISFNTFNDVCEAIGEESEGKKGLWLNVPDTIYELYPTQYGYESFTIKKGYQHLDCYNLLRYARARQNSSDFARARRQQIVIEAFKARLLQMDTITNPAKLKTLYDSFRNNAVYTEIELDEFVAGVSLLDRVRKSNVYHLVLDDQFGGQNRYLSKPTFSTPGIHNRPGYYLTAVDYNKDCCSEDNFYRVKKYIQSIMEEPEVYNEEAKVAIYTKNARFDSLPEKVSEWLSGEPPVYNLTLSKYAFTRELEEDVYVVDLSGGENPLTLDYLSDTLNAKVVTKEEVNLSPAHREEIAIIVN